MPTYQEVKPETDESIILARIEMMPQFLDLGLTAYLRGSFLENKKFRLENYFAGLGKEYMGTLIFEFARSTFSNREQRKLMMAQFSYDIFEWLVFESRYETGKRERDRDGESLEEKVSQMVFGFQYFPIPYLEIRPEYRYQKTEEYIMGYYAVQMHMFF